MPPRHFVTQLIENGTYPRFGPQLGQPERATDLGNARRAAFQHGRDLRCVGGDWYVWDGTRFALDTTGEVWRRAKETVRTIIGEAQELEADDARRQMQRHALASEGANRLRAMIDLARTEPPIACSRRVFDADPWLFNCSNGTLDLRAGVLTPHSRDDLITKLSGTTYDAAALCPAWDAFLCRIFDGNAAVIEFVQKAAGYSLVGVTTEQVLFFLYGTGANGKSTLVEILKSVFGDYARTADFSTFATRRNNDGPRNDIARLQGARLVAATEFSGTRALDEIVIKQLTGGDTVAARMLYHESEEFVPAFTPWIAGNHKPVIKGTDEAIWRRLRLIPFTVTIPEAERDPHLRERLLAEAPGILAWAVRGCLAWQQDGLQAPREVLAATSDYRAEMDTVGPFLEARTVADSRASVKATDLFRDYQTWAAAQGEEPISQMTFGLRLTEKGFAAQKRSGARWRLGLRLRGEQEELSEGPLW